jgi:short-subunit dehydrogenase
MSKALPWKTAWITGGSSGIGAAIAANLASKGVRVAISGRDTDKLLQVAGNSTLISPYALDVRNAAAVAEIFQQVEEDAGPLDLIIAGAGIYAPVTAGSIRPEQFAEMIEVNYLGAVHVLAACLPSFRRRGRGQVGLIASVAGYRGLPKAAAYGPTKAALINLAESLQPELAAEGVRLSVINPGFVSTPMTAANDFPMPFVMEPAQAAQRTIDGLRRGRYEVAFPRRFAIMLKALRLLPAGLHVALMRRVVLSR